MSSLVEVLIYGGIAGLAIPVGALLSRYESIHSKWLESEVRHGIVAFAAGALLAAIALVLIPAGIDTLELPALSVAFFGGGLTFAWLDWYLARHGSALGQFVAMLSDFVPECLALGALFVANPAGGRFLAILIAVQNLPEAFSSYHEMATGTKEPPRRALFMFALLAPVGPLAAYLGMSFLSNEPALISMVMTFSAGGILYLLFQDIAPKVPLRNSWLPPMGALVGFFIGVLGTVLVE